MGEEQALKMNVNMNVNINNLNDCLEKAKLYVELLKEAKTLAEELASVDFEVEIT